MIKNGDVKVTPNEYAKLFLANNLDIMFENIDLIMNKNPKFYNAMTANEKKSFKEQLKKKVDAYKKIMGIVKLKEKVGLSKPAKKTETKKVSKKSVKKVTKKKSTKKVASKSRKVNK